MCAVRVRSARGVLRGARGLGERRARSVGRPSLDRRRVDRAPRARSRSPRGASRGGSGRRDFARARRSPTWAWCRSSWPSNGPSAATAAGSPCARISISASASSHRGHRRPLQSCLGRSHPGQRAITGMPAHLAPSGSPSDPCRRRAGEAAASYGRACAPSTQASPRSTLLRRCSPHRRQRRWKDTRLHAPPEGIRSRGSPGEG
jgi:hypothetical protein